MPSPVLLMVERGKSPPNLLHDHGWQSAVALFWFMSSRKLRLAIIGVSGYAGILLRSLFAVLETRKAELLGAAIINPEEEAGTCRLLEERGCRVYRDYREMLEKGYFDLCIVPTSIHSHREIAIDALRAGANVLVEKPLAGNVADAEAIIEMSRNTGKFVAVGFQDIYCDQTRSIRQYLLSEELGRVRTVHAEGSWPRGEPYYLRNAWAGKEYCDGRAVFDSPLNNAFAHMLNLGLWLLSSDDRENVQLGVAEGGLFRFFPIETYDSAACMLTTSLGAKVSGVFTHADPEIHDPRMTIRMEDGEITWFFEKAAIARDRQGTLVRSWPLRSNEALRRIMLHEVLSCLSDGGAPSCSAVSALLHARAVECLQSSLEVSSGQSLLPDAPRPVDPWQLVPGVFEALKSLLAPGQPPPDPALRTSRKASPEVSCEPAGSAGDSSSIGA